MTSPQSTMFGTHFFAFCRLSTSLGLTNSMGLYRYQPFNAATVALTLASLIDPPTPSPNLSKPEYTPTTNTGCELSLPVSDISLGTGGSKPSRLQRSSRSLLGSLNVNS